MWSANIACIFTVLNLCGGFFAILCCGFYATMMHKMSMTTMEWALAALVAAFICDFFDGYLARMTNLSSAFGERLDSLADLTSFGVAPIAFALFARREWDFGLLFACGLYLVCGAVRLARYDPLAQSKLFKGLPIPVAGLTLASFTLTSRWLPWFDIAPAVLGFLMISDLPFVKASFSGSRKWMPIAFIVLFIASFVISGDLATAILTFTVAYLLANLLWALVRDVLARMRSMQANASARAAGLPPEGV